MKHSIQACNENHLPEILRIYNEVIENGTALYYYQPRTLDEMRKWFGLKRENNIPVLGSFSPENALLGFATFGPFRNWPAYQYTVEHSVYIRDDMRGKGLGKALLTAIINEVRSREYHVLIGGVDSSNTASARLHEKLGFERCGTFRQVGYKFDRWLDLDFYQLIVK